MMWSKEDIKHLQVLAGYLDDNGKSKASRWLFDKIKIIEAEQAQLEAENKHREEQ